jgi:hypothetical protein
MARVVRPELREYSVSPTPTMQYRSLSDFIGASILFGDAAAGVYQAPFLAPSLGSTSARNLPV